MFPLVFCNPLRQIANLSICPVPLGATESTSVASSLDLLEKNKETSKKVNVGHGKIGLIMGRKDLPFVHHSLVFDRQDFKLEGGVVSMGW